MHPFFVYAEVYADSRHSAGHFTATPSVVTKKLRYNSSCLGSSIAVLQLLLSRRSIECSII